MRKSHIIITAFLAAAGLTVNAQLPEQPKSQLSANAASLGEYGDVPVSLFTGIPQVEIPLYELQCGDHKFPISLTYHGGGVRPDQMPGWVGQGWSLNAGGCITRVVKGQPDEFDCDNALVNIGGPETGFLYQYDILDSDTWNDSLAILHMIYDNSTKYYDTEPDEFSFNFLDYHGKFYMGHDGLWKVMSDRPIKVSHSGAIYPYTGMDSNLLSFSDNQNVGYTQAIRQFEILGEDGTRYVFGGTSDAIEFSTDFVKPHRDKFWATTWNLTRVEYTDGRVIDLDYEAHYHGDLGDFTTFEAQLGVSCSEVVSCVYEIGNQHQGFTNHPVDTIAKFQGCLIRPSYLRSISCGKDTVLFDRERIPYIPYDLERMYDELCQRDYLETGGGGGAWQSPDAISTFLPLVYSFSVDMDSNDAGSSRPDSKGEGLNNYSALKWFKLTDITIINGIDILKRFAFDYSDPHCRLFLDKVTELDAQWGKGREYTMTYNHPEELPGFASGKTDHWGFYNGLYANPYFPSTYYNYREPESSLATIGALVQIDYPTGGFTRFEYEPHRYGRKVGLDHRTYSNVTGTAGGIRIRRIVSKAEENADSVVKEYFYVRGFTPTSSLQNLPSSGVLASNPKYLFSNYQPAPCTQGATLALSVFSTQSVTAGNENAAGCHIGYSEVIERQSDGSVTQYHFSNFDNGDYGDRQADLVMQSAHVECEPFTSRKALRGRMLDKTEFKLQNGHLTPHKSVSYTYETNQDESVDYARAVKVSNHLLQISNPNINIEYTECAAYRQHVNLLRPISELFTDYGDSGTEYTKTTSYTYNNDNLVTSLNETAANGTAQVKEITYPSTMLRPDMYNAHILSTVLEEDVSRVSGGSTLPVSCTRFNYDLNMVRPSSIWRGIGSNTPEKRSEYLFDSFCNPIQETIDSVKHTVYVWGYGGRYIVATVENATVADVTPVLGDLSAFAQSDTPNFTNLETLRHSLTSAKVTTYRYRPSVGLIETVAPDGRSTTYEYDALGRLSLIRDNDGNILKTYEYNYRSNENN